MSSNTSFVPFHTLSREWDARFNVPTDEDLGLILSAIKQEVSAGKFRYVLVGGVEIGDRPFMNDYLIKHVHVALIYNNRVSKSSILKNLQFKQGNGYYLVPRNQELPYAGWKNHHTKALTKVNDVHQLYEYGVIPEDKPSVAATIVKRSPEEKKRKLDEIIIEMKGMIEEGREAEAFTKFPRNYLTYGEKLKAMVAQKRDFFKSNGDPHIWLYGNPGTGKSAILQVVYPAYYNKNMDNRFFDLYKPEQHTHMLLQDVDYTNVERLGVQFLKTICDEAGFPVDQKYKTPQLARTTVLVSSNFRIHDVLPEDMPGRNEQLNALRRRFWEVNVTEILRILGIKLLSKYEITQLKKAGNTDPSKIFIAWDYLRDTPTGEALKEPKDYQELLKHHYYGA